jgi:hypothetical protein
METILDKIELGIKKSTQNNKDIQKGTKRLIEDF